METDLNNRPLKDWSEAERIENVKKIFNEITPTYDKMNRIMSARQDVGWRKFTVKRLPKHSKQVLDIATGTGDLALDIARLKPEIMVYGADFVKRMVDVGVQKTEKKKLNHRIEYLVGDGVNLPFEDNSFDATTIAFGLRNIPRRLDALKEMSRVVRPGGKVMVLEMTFPRNMKMRKFFYWYLNNVIPILGKMIAGNSPAYKYLPASIQDFLHPDVLSELFKEAGLENVKAFPMSFGITYLHEGIVV